jgi:hypothetical protein
MNLPAELFIFFLLKVMIAFDESVSQDLSNGTNIAS